ncbi:MAG: SDR family oxidoreductase, partial [Myxococcales bacterium]|nr:SDR family oxidoreductase [Myxococcales bacterium]
GVGVDDRAARVAADLYEHTIAVITDAEAVGRYQALPEDDIFDMEYWPLEQAKLGRRAAPALGGRVVLITGAASGIGRACARRFAEAGAALFLVDRDGERLAAVADGLRAAYAVVDVGDRAAVEGAVDACVRRYGGLDGLVANAGFAPQAPIADCPHELLEESLQVNLLGQQWLAAAATAVMRAQGRGGFLLFNASKAAFNPGRDFGPYAIAKAGVIALMKQYALEYGGDGIRSNAINADRIRTGLFPKEVVAARAQARGLDPDDYFRTNLLQREVTADDVALAFLYLALAPSTTAAVLTVDGGNIAASPR